MHAVMAGHSSVSGFSLDDAVCCHEDACHKAEGAEALGDDVRLDVAVVVLASPDEAAV